jgi:hypothetical protein
MKTYTTVGRPPVPIPRQLVDPTTSASLLLPLFFQPYPDLEKISGGGALAEEVTVSSYVDVVSKTAGFDAVAAEEPSRGYLFKASFLYFPYLLTFVGCLRRCFHPHPFTGHITIGQP